MSSSNHHTMAHHCERRQLKSFDYFLLFQIRLSAVVLSKVKQLSCRKDIQSQVKSGSFLVDLLFCLANFGCSFPFLPINLINSSHTAAHYCEVWQLKSVDYFLLFRIRLSALSRTTTTII